MKAKIGIRLMINGYRGDKAAEILVNVMHLG